MPLAARPPYEKGMTTLTASLPWTDRSGRVSGLRLATS